MTARARFRYSSPADPDDTSPVSLPGFAGATPSIIEPGDVFEVELDDQAMTTTLDEHGVTVPITVAEQTLEALRTDPRFSEVDEDEPVTGSPAASDGMTAADLRAALQALRETTGSHLPDPLPRKRAELADLFDAFAGPPVPSETEES
jgi:hypothetical protein